MSKATYTNGHPEDLLSFAQEVGAENNPLPEYTMTTWPEAGFQLCPKCEGSGALRYSHEIYRVNTSSICPVCKGKMIINCKTGKPPEN